MQMSLEASRLYYNKKIGNFKFRQMQVMLIMLKLSIIKDITYKEELTK